VCGGGCAVCYLMGRITNPNITKGTDHRSAPAEVYYRSNFLTLPGLLRIPFTQVRLSKTGINNENTLVQFAIIRQFLFFCIAIFLISWIAYFLSLFGLIESEFTYGKLILYWSAFYFVSYFRFMIELNYFEREVEKHFNY